MQARSRPAGIAATLGAALLLAWVAYVAIGLVVLNTGLIASALTDEEDDSLRFAHGFTFSPWPGRVHVRDLDLRYQDRNIAFRLQIDHVVTDIVLHELFEQQFHAKHIRAKGISYQMLHKLDDLAANEDRARAFPQVFEWPPMRQKQKGPSSNPEELWSIHLSDVEGEVKELWFLEYRWTGKGHVSGAFQLIPLASLWIGPATLHLDPGLVTVADRLLVRDFGGDISTVVPPFDPDEPEGLEILDHFSGTLKVAGRIETLAPIDRYMKKIDVAIDRPQTLTADFSFQNGVVSSGSNLQLRSPSFSLSNKALSFDTALAIDLTAPEEREQLRVAFALRKLRAKMDGKTAARVPKADLTLATRTRRLADLGGFRLQEIEAPSIAADDLSRLSSLLPENMKLLGGSAKGSVSLIARGDEARGKAAIAIDRGSLWLGKRSFTASGTVSTNLVMSLEGGGGALNDFQAYFPRIFVNGETRKGGGWWRVESRRFAFDDLPPKQFSGAITVRGQSGESIVAMLPSLGTLGDAFVGALPIGRVEVEARVDHGPYQSAIDLVKARSGGVSGHGRWRKRGEQTRGAFLASVGPLSAGLTVGTQGLKVSPLATSDWLEERYRELALEQKAQVPSGSARAGR